MMMILLSMLVLHHRQPRKNEALIAKLKTLGVIT